MVNLSRTALRGLAGVAALASLTVAALPSAQANQASGANTPTAPSADVPAQVVGTPPPGDGVTAKSVKVGDTKAAAPRTDPCGTVFGPTRTPVALEGASPMPRSTRHRPPSRHPRRRR